MSKLKVINPVSKNKSVTIGSLKHGEIFMCGNKLYINTDSDFVINILNGEVVETFKDNDTIVQIEATLTIEKII